MIHRDRNENETENNPDTLNKAIEECPDIASPHMMEDCEDIIYRDVN